MNSQKLDVLVFAAHPDDAELACSGTIVKHINLGYKVGIIDLTEGELGTRGNREIRKKESQDASSLMNLSARENLGLADGFFSDDRNAQLKIINVIRKYRPKTIIVNAIEDRHPDHARAGNLVSKSAFLSGLRKIETEDLEHWRPKNVYNYIQDHYRKPDFVIDISSEFEQKMNVIKCFKSQFYSEESKEPETPISNKDFLIYIESRAREFGRLIGTTFGEGFNVQKPIAVSNLLKMN